MRPILNFLVQHLARTLSGNQLSMSVQLVVGSQLAQSQPLFDQPQRGLQLSIGWHHLDKCADKCYANRSLVVAQCVRSLCVPASTLVRGAVASHQEVVRNVIPFHRLHVVRLHEANTEHTFSLKLTPIRVNPLTYIEQANNEPE